MANIGKLTTNAITEIDYLTNQLSYLLEAHESEFWLHVDGTKLERIELELQMMVDEINDEVDSPF